MSEYIERGAAVQALVTDYAYAAADIVSKLPAADVVKVKHGRWGVGEKCNHKPCRIKNPDKWVIYKCSVCGYSNGRKRSNYCPNCGAKMDGE